MRELEGLRALDRFTLQIRFRRPNFGFEWWLATNQFSAVAREVVDAYKDSSNRVMENPGGHRRLPAEAVDARPAHPARSQSGLSRRRRIRRRAPGSDARRRRDRARACGQEAPARRQRGHLDHRGGAAAAPVVRFRRARLRRAAGDALPQRARRRGAQARVREARHRAAPPGHAVRRVLLLQPR